MLKRILSMLPMVSVGTVLGSPISYSIMPLPIPSGAYSVGVVDIRDDGTVLGNAIAFDAQRERSFSTVIWNGGTPSPVPVSQEFSFQAIELRHDGTVLGMTTTLDYSYFASIMDEGRSVRISPAPPMETFQTRPGSANRLGEIAATWYADGRTGAFVWQDGTAFSLSAPIGLSATASDINDAGIVVGSIETSPGRFSAALWRDGQFMPIPDPQSATFTTAAFVNNAGTIILESYLENGPGSTLNRSYFRFVNANLDPLPSLIDSQPTSVFDINSEGDLVGSSAGRAVLWRGHQIFDLNLLLAPGTGWFLSDATAINDVGQITGHGFLNGQLQPFLLTPISGASIPEPASLTLLSLLPSLLRRRPR